MGATILESLSNIKLTGILTFLLVVQVICFYIGAFITPSPDSLEQFTSFQCLKKDKQHMAIPRHHKSKHDVEIKRNCDHSSPNLSTSGTGKFATTTTFAVQLPLPRDGLELSYSRWMQNLLVMLTPEFQYEPLLANAILAENGHHKAINHRDLAGQIDYQFPIFLDVDLAVKDEGDKDWKIYARRRNIKRTLKFDEKDFKHNHRLDCEPIQLFELQSLHYDYYLINFEIRDDMIANKTLKFPGRLNEVTGVAIRHNGGFTKIWLSIKTIFFIATLSTLIWYCGRLSRLNRKTILIERLLIGLGAALTQLNAPVEFLSLYFEISFMTFMNDLRQGIFYCVLLSFWIIFVGEHLLDGTRKESQLANYTKELLAICVASLSLLIFDLSERGIQVVDPFMTIWESRPNLARLSILTASFACMAYMGYLLYYIYLAFGTISGKQSSLPKMQITKRLKYQGMIYRFQFLLWTTTICAIGTLVFYGLSQRNDWSDDEDSPGTGIIIEWTSAMLISVCAMWNLYVIILMILYAPSYKGLVAGACPSDQIEFISLTEDGVDEDTYSDMKLLQDMINKTTLD